MRDPFRLCAALLLAALLGASGCSTPLSGKDPGNDPPVPAGSEISLDGEIVDLECYLKDPVINRGFYHAKCAAACIRRGEPAAIVSEGQVYLLLGPDRHPVNSHVAKLAGSLTTVSGTLIHHRGMFAIQVREIAGIPLD